MGSDSPRSNRTALEYLKTDYDFYYDVTDVTFNNTSLVSSNSTKPLKLKVKTDDAELELPNKIRDNLYSMLH